MLHESGTVHQDSGNHETFGLCASCTSFLYIFLMVNLSLIPGVAPAKPSVSQFLSMVPVQKMSNILLRRACTMGVSPSGTIQVSDSIQSSLVSCS
jgi:hypothetical protein